MSNFTIIKKEDFENFLPDDFSLVEGNGSKEIIYEIPTGDQKFNIRIYSSIDIRTNDSRDIGKDAIRCVLVDNKSKKPVSKAKRTHRTENWRDRLKEKIDTLREQINDIKICKTCGNPMIRRKGKYGDFYSCSQYPICTTTMDLNGKYKEKINTDEEDFIVRCPDCDGLMKKRSGSYGEFYGCENFYKNGCTGKRKVVDVEVYGQGKEGIKKDEDTEEKKEIQGQIDIPTNNDNVELIKTEKFPYLSFPFEYFNPVQSRVFEFYSQDVNMVVAAATSAGKTTIAEMVMSNAIHNGKKAIFLSPLKAVSQEKYDDWINENHGFSKLNVSIVTGDYILTEARVKELNNADVIIMTTEMLDSRTRRIHSEKNDWLLEVGVVVYDEFHLITMSGRGDKVESSLMRFSQQNSSCRIVALSATMPNVSELAKWFTLLNCKESKLINSSYRPCQLDIHYVPYLSRGRYAEIEQNKKEEVLKLIKNFKDDKFIIFVHSKKIGREIEALLKNQKEKVMLHNAELTREDRIKVTQRFKEDLRIIVATSTLAWGINLPARRVIVVGVHRGLQEVEPLDIKQESGRAGRVGLDPKGDSYILLPDTKFNYYKNWCQNIPPITSTMNNPDILAFHIVSEISSGEVYDISSLMKWYNRSLAAFQSDILDRVDAEELLEKLEKCKILESKNGKYKVTQLGKVASNLYFSPYSISGWYFNFNKIFNKDIVDDVCISWALSNIQENNGNYIDKRLDSKFKSYMDMCHFNGLDMNDGPGCIGLYFYSCLTYDENVNSMYKSNVKYDIERIVTALSMIDSNFAFWGKKNFFKKIGMRVQYEISEEMTELCTLKWIGGASVRKLFEANIKTIKDLKRNKDKAQYILKEKNFRKVFSENNLD